MLVKYQASVSDSLGKPQQLQNDGNAQFILNVCVRKGESERAKKGGCKER